MKPSTAEKNNRDGVFGRDAEGRRTITFERHFDHPIESVWRAITDSEAAKGWLGALEVEPRVGGRYAMRLDGTDPNGHVTVGEVTAYEAPTLLECWIELEDRPESDDHHVLRWELQSTNEGCSLIFCNTFALGERARNSIVCGWHGKLDQIISTVEGQPEDWATFDRSRIIELYWRYRNKPLAEE